MLVVYGIGQLCSSSLGAPCSPKRDMKLNDVTSDLVIHREVYTDAVVNIWRFWAKARLFNVLYVLNNAALTEEKQKKTGRFSSFLHFKSSREEKKLFETQNQTKQ